MSDKIAQFKVYTLICSLTEEYFFVPASHILVNKKDRL